MNSEKRDKGDEKPKTKKTPDPFQAASTSVEAGFETSFPGDHKFSPAFDRLVHGVLRIVGEFADSFCRILDHVPQLPASSGSGLRSQEHSQAGSQNNSSYEGKTSKNDESCVVIHWNSFCKTVIG
jgi:hypothetical protein